MSDNENSVYVGNLDPKVSKELLYELFVQVSPIVQIKYPKDKVSQAHQGYAFVEFYDKESAEYAGKVMNNTVQLFGRQLKVRKSKHSMNASDQAASSSGAENLPVAKIFIRNIDSTVDQTQLSKVFKKFGALAREPEIFYSKTSHLKCAFVYFKNYEHSDLAIKTLNDQIIGTQRVEIDYAFKENSDGGAKHGDATDRLLNREALKNGIIK